MPVNVQSIVGEKRGRHLLIMAGVHGDEFEPIAAVRQLSKLIDPTRLSGRLTLIPIVNEPAFQNASRTGPDGLDLARVMPGSESGSITEQIACEASRSIRDCDFLIDLHTGGLAMKISALSGYMLHENAEIRETQKRMATAFNLPIIWATSSQLNGRSLSVARDAGVPAIYAEWGGGTGCDSDGVQDYVDGCLNVMQELEFYEHPKPTSRVQYVVEDFRHESGVLQRNCPAPHAGFFQPAVMLGDRVEAGDVLGRIDVSGNASPTEILATQRGIVILLRCIPSVKQGDCLATVLEAHEPGVYRYE